MSRSQRLYADRVLIDSSAFFAMYDRMEISHSTAVATRTRLIAEHWKVFTTNFVIAETHALILARRGRDLAADALRKIDASPTTIVRVSVRDERQAREILRHYDDKDFSLTDAISFAVMDRLRIGYAFTFDHHFAQYGVMLTA